MKLLCLSNGHGEDVIAVAILKQLQHHFSSIELAALPLVGEGRAYTHLDIPIIGEVQRMPSGGFIYMDGGKQLWRDVKGGLVGLTIAQYKIIRRWGKTGGAILAVGDIVPLLFAWLSGAPYFFVGTAKSEYYLRDEMGWLSSKAKWEGWSGSVYLPWERWLMSRRRCKGVFPRDKLTSEILRRWKIPVFDLGNPMMDGLEVSSPLCTRVEEEEQEKERLLTIVLLPGSRIPEAYENWQLILQGLKVILTKFPGRPVLFLGAIAPSLDLKLLWEPLASQGWQSQPLATVQEIVEDDEAMAFTQSKGTLILTQQTYTHCLNLADFAIAMTGTATEQFVGLGKPAISFPGNGPQFTSAFAEAQTRLLGPSVTCVQTPQKVADALQSLLQDPDRLQFIAENGPRRMGKSGAAYRIANCMSERLIVDC